MNVDDDAWFARLPVGSLVRILPNHACITCAGYEAFEAVRGEHGGWALSARQRLVTDQHPLPRHPPHAHLAVDRVVRLRRREDQAVALEASSGRFCRRR